ncbi:MAG: sigma-70 family RNA polymerase sigma factor [Planctomycetota bacterium]
MNQTESSSTLASPNHDETVTDHAWISDVFRDFEGPLMGYASHLVGNRERASDIVQDTFVRLCKQSRQQIEPRVRSWLFTVCRNRALDVLKKESRMKTLEDDPGARASERDDPGKRLETAEQADGAKSLIANLPQRQQEVIRLKIQGGLSYREISELTGLSVGNVGYLLSTALQSVRHKLAPID